MLNIAFTANSPLRLSTEEVIYRAGFEQEANSTVAQSPKTETKRTHLDG